MLDLVSFVPSKKVCRLVAVILAVLVLKEVLDYVRNKDQAGQQSFDIIKKKAFPGQSDLPVISNTITGEVRAELVRQRCAEVYPDPSSLSNRKFAFDRRMFVAHKKGFLYCSIGKTGTSNWKRVVKYLISEEAGKGDVSQLSNPYPHWLPWFGDNVLYKLSAEHQKWSLSRYYKFLFVRDPLKRAISAYRDKFLGDAADFAAGFADEAHDHYKRVVAKYICSDLSEYVATKPQNLDIASLRLNCTTEYHTFSLKAFLTWLYVMPYEGGGREFREDHFNPHWCPMIPLCSICNDSFSYDYIGRLETMSDDVSTLFNLLNLTFPFPTLSDTALSDDVRARLILEEQGLDRSFLEQIDRVVNRERYVLGYTDELYDSGEDPYI